MYNYIFKEPLVQQKYTSPANRSYLAVLEQHDNVTLEVVMFEKEFGKCRLFASYIYVKNHVGNMTFPVVERKITLYLW